jgi:hypothetical protein
MVGLARPAGAVTLWAALAFFATGASAQTTPAPMLPGAPWAAPVLPPSLAQPGARGAVSPDKLRPAEHNLIDCKGAPATAVTRVPGSLTRWATIYCTRQGHILTTNEQFYSSVPGTRGALRGVLSAAQIDGRTGEVGHGAYFTKIEYAPLSKQAAQQLLTGADPEVVKLAKDKPLFRLDLTADSGQSYRGVVVDPAKDPFWVIPVVDGKLGKSGFYVASVDFVNRTRMQ